MLVHFGQSTAFGIAAQLVHGRELAQHRCPRGRASEVIEPWGACLRQACEEDCGRLIFLHRFIQPVGKFLETCSAVDGEGNS